MSHPFLETLFYVHLFMPKVEVELHKKATYYTICAEVFVYFDM